jgi:hypothetical protein
MKKNMGRADRITRLLIVVVIAVLYYRGILSGGWAIAGGIVALIFLLTSFISFCPLYTLVGINTCTKNS